MAGTLQVLFVEDSENDVQLMLRELRRGGWEIIHEIVDSAAAMTAALCAHAWDIIIADYSMPNFSGTAALALANEQAHRRPVYRRLRHDRRRNRRSGDEVGSG